MRRAVLIITVLFTIGLIATVLSAWACAMWSRPMGSDALWLAGVRRDFFERSPSTYTSRPCEGLFVAFGHYGIGTQFLDVASDEPIELLGPAILPDTRLNMLRAGWPWMALEGWLEHDASRIGPVAFPPKYHYAIVDKKRVIRADRVSMERMIPLRPIWPGFVMNWLFWTLVFGLLWLAALTARRFLRHLRRQCLACGYPTGTSPICTECGRRVSAKAIAASR